MKKRISILGATGSIGRSTLDVISRHRDRFELVVVSAFRDVAVLAEIAREHKVELAVIADSNQVDALTDALRGTRTKIAAGQEALVEAACYPTDYMMMAISGIAGLPAVLAAAGQKIRLALANKESIICAGPLLRRTAAKSGCEILPVDSEHHALFRLLGCLPLTDLGEVVRATLTASGGPFLRFSVEEMRLVSPEQAVSHPNWDMGAKISVDSATLVNKVLELIEAHFLFDLSAEQLGMVIHPQSLVHALVERRGGGVLAFLSPADMRVVIADLLGVDRSGVRSLDVAGLGLLEFESVDRRRFPVVDLAGEVLRRGGGMAVVLNAANEAAVASFLARRIGFMDISRIVCGVVEDKLSENLQAPADLRAILELDRLIHRQTEERIEVLS